MNKSKTLAEIIKYYIGSPFLDDIVEHQSEHIRKQLKREFVEVHNNGKRR